MYGSTTIRTILQGPFALPHKTTASFSGIRRWQKNHVFVLSFFSVIREKSLSRLYFVSRIDLKHIRFLEWLYYIPPPGRINLSSFTFIKKLNASPAKSLVKHFHCYLFTRSFLLCPIFPMSKKLFQLVFKRQVFFIKRQPYWHMLDQ